MAHRGQAKKHERAKTMNMKKKLQNPFALIAQGFICGAAIFYVTMPANVDVQPTVSPVQSVQTAVASEFTKA